MDDTLWHQLPTTFDHVGTSDPRFFDRYWFVATDPSGGGTLQLTLGAYQNMNVMDGGFVFVSEGRQHNLRVSRALRPEYATRCGPIEVELLEPLARFRLRVADDESSVRAELEWSAEFAAQEEVPQFVRQRGRVVRDSRRFDQIGACSGWVEVRGERTRVERWWAARDHSWGVRERVGIDEPQTGPASSQPAGSLFAFLFFSTSAVGGHVQISSFADEDDYLSAEVARRGAGAPVHFARAKLRAELVDERSPRRFRTAWFDAELADGRPVEIEMRALGSAIDMQGLGYGGYEDGRGLGVYRGESHVERDVWDVSHPCEVVRGAERVRPIHRIQPVRVALRGGGIDSEGTGSLTFIAEGRLPQLGLG